MLGWQVSAALMFRRFLTALAHDAELQSKLDRESTTREEAVSRAETAEHQCSMLGLDLKTTHAELQQLKQELAETQLKVSFCKQSCVL